jgi:hypothetical protein
MPGLLAFAVPAYQRLGFSGIGSGILFSNFFLQRLTLNGTVMPFLYFFASPSAETLRMFHSGPIPIFFSVTPKSAV